MLIDVQFTYPEPSKINSECHVVTRGMDGKLRSVVALDGSGLDAVPLTTEERDAVRAKIAAAKNGLTIWQPPAAR